MSSAPRAIGVGDHDADGRPEMLFRRTGLTSILEDQGSVGPTGDVAEPATEDVLGYVPSSGEDLKRRPDQVLVVSPKMPSGPVGLLASPTRVGPR
jgi:hypothetical protein